MARITRMAKLRLGELLQAAGLVSEEQVRAGLEEQRKANLFLGEALVKLGFVTEEAMAQAIIQQFSLPFIAPGQFNISPEVFNLFPERMYYEYQFVAADKLANVVTIVAAGVMNYDVTSELERLSGCRVCQFVSTWKEIRAVIEKFSRDNAQKAELTDLGSMLLNSGEFPKEAAANVPLPAAPAAGAAPAARRSSHSASAANLKPLAVMSSTFLASVSGSAKTASGQIPAIKSALLPMTAPGTARSSAMMTALKSSALRPAVRASGAPPSGVTPAKGATATTPLQRLTAFAGGKPSGAETPHPEAPGGEAARKSDPSKSQ